MCGVVTSKMLNIQESYLSWSFKSSQFDLDLEINFGNHSVRFGNCSEIARGLNSKVSAVERKYCKKMTNIRKRRKSQDSRIKTLFAEIFNFNFNSK